MTRIDLRIIEAADGTFNVINMKTEETAIFRRQELANYIDPRPEPTEYDLAYKTHLQEVASKAKSALVDHLQQNQFNCAPVKSEIQASDFLKAEAAKAQSYKCTAPPYPSNQANLAQINLNAANTYSGGVQRSMNNPYGNYHLQNCVPGDLNAKQEVNPELSKLLQSDPVKCIEKLNALKESKEPKPFITDKVRHMIEFAVRAGYGNNLARFAADVQTLKEHANLQDDGK